MTSQQKKTTGGYQAADPNGVNNAYAGTMANMSTADRDALQQYSQDYDRYAVQEEQALTRAASESEKELIRQQYAALKNQAHVQAEAIRAKYGYSGGQDGSEYLTTGGEVPLLTNRAPDLTGHLDKWQESAREQQEGRIDHAVQTGVAELERAEADAQAQFQTQQDQVDRDEARALDNQALYAEARGDRGGIGQAQYGQIQAAAQANRRAVQSARVKLSTDTARQMADLQAKGEFEKADALLELTQNYLAQLIDLEQWSAEFNLGVDKFNSQIQRWQVEYQLEVNKLLQSNARAAQEAQTKTLADSGKAALAAGVRPTAAQQAAMGYTDAQIQAELKNYQQQQAAKNASNSTSKSSSGTGSSVTLINQRRKNLTNAGLASLEMGLRPTAEQQATMGYTDAQVDRAILMYWREQGRKMREEQGYL